MSDAQSKKKRSGINWAKLQNTPQLICISLNNNNPYCNLTPSSKMQPRGNPGEKPQRIFEDLQGSLKICKDLQKIFEDKDLSRILKGSLEDL